MGVKKEYINLKTEEYCNEKETYVSDRQYAGRKDWDWDYNWGQGRRTERRNSVTYVDSNTSFPESSRTMNKLGYNSMKL